MCPYRVHTFSMMDKLISGFKFSGDQDSTASLGNLSHYLTVAFFPNIY